MQVKHHSRVRISHTGTDGKIARARIGFALVSSGGCLWYLAILSNCTQTLVLPNFLSTDESVSCSSVSRAAPQSKTSKNEIRALTSPPSRRTPLALAAAAPHALQQAIPLRQPVETVVALAHRPNESTQRIHLVLPRVSPILVHLADGYLYGCVVFGFDDAVGG